MQLRGLLVSSRYLNPTPADGLHEYLMGDLGGGTEAALPELFYIGIVTAFPDYFGHTKAEIFARYGFIENPDTGLPYGVVPVQNAIGQRYFQSTCSLCHTGRVNGEVVHGAGNPNLSLTLLTRDVAELILSGQLTEGILVESASAYMARTGDVLPPQDNLVLRLTYRYLQSRLLEQPDYARLDASPGRNGPVEYAKLRLDMAIDTPQGPVKFPAIWYWDRSRTRFTSDGAFVGDGLYLPLAPAFTGGREAENVVRDLSPFAAVVTWAESVEPPPYPGLHDLEAGARGELIYSSECASCHGQYSADGTFRYPERIIPWEMVRTDRARMDSMSGELVRRYNRPALAPYLKLENTGGYLAPNLQGIWARGPYLHNGSVPSLTDLLLPVPSRPEFFYTGREPAYDLQRVGLACAPAIEGSARGCAPTRAQQYRFDTSAAGNGNGGHEFGTSLSSDDIAALIEYLKTI